MKSYVVIFFYDDGKELYCKMFDTAEEAVKYRDSVAPSRQPTIYTIPSW